MTDHDCDCRCHEIHVHVHSCDQCGHGSHDHPDGTSTGGKGSSSGSGGASGHDGGSTGGGSGGGGNPNRPGRGDGVDRGRTDDPTPLTKGDLGAKNPSGSWAGPRKHLHLPYVMIRAFPKDLGSRPVVGPFWESPDVFILADTDPASAPPVPPALGQLATANRPNTVYAHVWNFGRAPAPNVVVEFLWCNPTLGVDTAHPIGDPRRSQVVISLGACGAGRSHALVKCPEPWIPQYVNGGHECLVVRAWDYTSDTLGTPHLDARLNRHVGQRNIHVAQAHSPNPLGTTPIILNVGQLYGAPADVAVTRVGPTAMPWLQLHTGQRGVFPPEAYPTGTPLLSPPGPVGGGFSFAGAGTNHQVTADNQQVRLTTTDESPLPGEAHVYRVQASQGGELFGGYTVVITAE